MQPERDIIDHKKGDISENELEETGIEWKQIEEMQSRQEIMQWTERRHRIQMQARHLEYNRGIGNLLCRVEEKVGKKEETEPEEGKERKRTRCDQNGQ